LTIYAALVSIVILSSCGHTDKINEDTVARQFCDCFKGNNAENIDERMYPCMDTLINSKQTLIKEMYKEMPGDSAVLFFMRNVMVKMIDNCDEFFTQVDQAYYNMYPLDTSIGTRATLEFLNTKKDTITDPDSAVAVLHQLLTLQLQSRMYDKAILTSQQIEKINPKDVGASLALGYAYNGLKNYNQAITSIDNAIAINNDKDYYIFRAITLRRQKNGR
jgi:tetratricopeptide (TPR) repeat protein